VPHHRQKCRLRFVRCFRLDYPSGDRRMLTPPRAASVASGALAHSPINRPFWIAITDWSAKICISLLPPT
jgi:hypothetical protein